MLKYVYYWLHRYPHMIWIPVKRKFCLRCILLGAHLHRYWLANISMCLAEEANLVEWKIVNGKWIRFKHQAEKPRKCICLLTLTYWWTYFRYRFDTETKSWQILKPLRNANLRGTSGPVVRGKYIFLSYPGKTLIDVYDPEKDEWMPFPELHSFRGAFILTEINDSLYALGGGSDSRTARYDQRSKCWIEVCKITLLHIYVHKICKVLMISSYFFNHRINFS